MLFNFFVFILGLVVGSFLNSVIYRLYTKESFLLASTPRQRAKLPLYRWWGFQRSYCPECKHELAWCDLIPVFSFIILKGRCRYCRKPISWQYPLVELVTGILFIFVFSYCSDFWGAVYHLTIICFLIVVFVYDLRHYTIPDEVIYPLVGLVLIYNLLLMVMGHWAFWVFLNHLLSAILSAAFLGSVFLISKGRWMGFGDVKLVFFMGLLLGFPDILIALFGSFLVGGIIGLGLVAVGKKSLKSEVPFGPFLSFATFIAMFFGKELMRWYLSFLKF